MHFLLCRDLIFTKNNSYFKHSKNFVTGVSDSHNLTATATKTNLAKIKPKINYY